VTKMAWFWIITVQWSTGRDAATGTASGRLTAGQAAALGTRSAAYTAVISFCRRAAGMPDTATPVVLFFSLAPESLDPAVDVVALADAGLTEAS
jgi:hypothetical protein